ncbi:MAG: pentapeptide repeat-containing protein [Symploca sp. SIO3E6]|nr:pentapeptide repeat-containing protein [Caldora sp. SIO3E6]
MICLLLLNVCSRQIFAFRLVYLRAFWSVCNLGARLEGAHLEGAHLEGAHLEGAHLEGAHLEGAHLEGARRCAPTAKM